MNLNSPITGTLLGGLLAGSFWVALQQLITGLAKTNIERKAEARALEELGVKKDAATLEKFEKLLQAQERINDNLRSDLKTEREESARLRAENTTLRAAAQDKPAVSVAKQS